ncbi:MAG: ThuA domain-containing protein [Planctomycetaceae bacterium]|nr:ThuA domain-containing protein [Planctomycetaceae bacterium]
MSLKPVHLVGCILAVAAMLVVASAEKIPYAQTEIVPPTAEWCAKIEKAAPEKATVAADTRKLLVFSLRTGFDHKVMPHVDRVFEILGKKTGAFETTVTVDIEQLMPENLAKYDVLVLNNNCSVGPRRNLFLDELERNPKYADMTAEQRQAKSDTLEQSMLDFVAGGKGLVVVHGAPTLLNNSPKYTEMVGGAFDYHPPNQEVTVQTVDEDHPLVAAFKGKGPFIHRDEPYCFNGAYEKMAFRPLLSMDVEGLNDPKGRVGELKRYVAWIKPFGEGRVFYCSPSHFPESYESSTMLQFILDGVQYAAGDLKCDDSALPQEPAGKKG